MSDENDARETLLTLAMLGGAGVNSSSDEKAVGAGTYTALKGVISFQENAEDWRGMAVAYNRALRALELLAAPVEHQGGTDG